MTGIISDQAEWKDVILKSKRRKGWVETEDCNSDKEELNNNWNAVGPCMIDFGHTGPDKEDRRVKCEFRFGRTEDRWIKVRDSYRNYNRAPFFKPKTIQQEFHLKVLEGLTVVIDSARKLWHLAVDIWFDDGVIPGFIFDPVNYALEALNKARYAVRETIEVLNYKKDKLQYKVKRKK